MDIKEFYETIGGDYNAALLIMLNDDFITRMLDKFFEKNTYNDILSSYKNKDFEALFGYVHSFKGVVGNLGLIPLCIVFAVKNIHAIGHHRQCNWKNILPTVLLESALIHDLFLND